MKKRSIALALLCGFMPAGTFLRTPQTAAPTQEAMSEFDQITFKWMGTFAHILHLIKQKHYKAVNIENAWIRAMDAFLGQLDSHSGILDEKTYKSMLDSTRGQFFGIGVVIDNTRKTKDKVLTIVETIPEGPAEKEGLKPLDKIIEVDGQEIEGMTTEEITMKLKGPRHTKVQIKVLREGAQDLLTFDITRDVIRDQSSLSFYIKGHDIYYVSLTMFTENAARQIEQLLQKAHKKKFKGLILDLRNNSGGLLNAAVDIAGLFLEKNSLVVLTKDKDNQVIEEYRTSRAPITDASIPIFILINNYTASAAEILAGYLKTYSDKGGTGVPQVFLVGTKTFGKGSVQEVIPIENNCAIKLTTAVYYFADHTTIQGVGIEPDFCIERMSPPTEQMQWYLKNYGRECALENSIKTCPAEKEEIKKKEQEEKEKSASKQPTTWADRAKQMFQTDNQLRETISLINSLATAKATNPKLTRTRKDSLTFLKKHHLTNEILEIEEIRA
jgi:carboxyl-terminal processing protease